VMPPQRAAHYRERRYSPQLTGFKGKTSLFRRLRLC
jgi:hypothetical protein